MHKREEVFKCSICGNIVELIHASAGTLVCCGKNMDLLEEKTADFKTEKHVPIITESENGIKVVVGSALHPMASEHYIEWIEVIDGNNVVRKYLNPGDAPEVEFNIEHKDSLIVREYCNVHGLWKA